MQWPRLERPGLFLVSVETNTPRKTERSPVGDEKEKIGSSLQNYLRCLWTEVCC